MLEKEQITAIADELAEAEAQRGMIPLLTARHPEMTIEDSYAVQNEWRRRAVDSGRRMVGRKIGLTSKVMQVATGITEPDYGAIFDDMVYENGSVIEHSRFSNVRIEVELAFKLGKPLTGPGITLFDVLDATDYVVPALEILSSRIEMTAARSWTRSATTLPWERWSTAATRLPRMPWTCAGSPRCSTATRPSRNPAWPPPCSTTPPWEWSGWRTSSPSTETACRPAS